MVFIKSFKFRNTWTNIAEPNTPISLVSYDVEQYSSLPESLHDQPITWRKNWFVFYLGGEYDEDLYDDAEEVLCKYQKYILKSDAILKYKNGKYYTSIEIHGIDGQYNPDCFTTLTLQETVDVETVGNLLKDPPVDVPEYGTHEYRLLFKETGGSIDSISSTASDRQKTYIDHIKVTRKPEEYPQWLKELVESENAPSKAKLKNKDFFQ